MTDWMAVARARGFNIPEEELARIAPSLTALEAELRPLLKKLTTGDEPAVGFEA